ncbi:IclR family transcriptional regulator domain-containing protein [Mycobacterium sp. C31M]
MSVHRHAATGDGIRSLAGGYPAIRGFAAPIFDHTGVVAATVSVGGSADRIDVAGDHRLGEAVVEAAEAISALMGYRGIRENAEDG